MFTVQYILWKCDYPGRIIKDWEIQHFKIANSQTRLHTPRMEWELMDVWDESVLLEMTGGSTHKLTIAVVIHTRSIYSTTGAWRGAGNKSPEAEVLMIIDAC